MSYRCQVERLLVAWYWYQRFMNSWLSIGPSVTGRGGEWRNRHKYGWHHMATHFHRIRKADYEYNSEKSVTLVRTCRRATAVPRVFTSRGQLLDCFCSIGISSCSWCRVELQLKLDSNNRCNRRHCRSLESGRSTLVSQYASCPILR